MGKTHKQMPKSYFYKFEFIYNILLKSPSLIISIKKWIKLFKIYLVS
jgi:hypothetical protein